MSEREGAGDFSGKWRARWPEWSIAEVFVPAVQRSTAVAWLALMQEFADAAAGGTDRAPGLAKLAWWQEELRGWAKGAYRHPLGSVLQPQPASWQALADRMTVLRHREALLDGAHVAAETLQPFAAVAAEIEQQLFGGGTANSDGIALAMVIGPGSTPEDREAALRVFSMPMPGSTPRRLFNAMVAARLAQPDDAGGGTVPRLSMLWRAWRAARN